jgi:hypothetical protein
VRTLVVNYLSGIIGPPALHELDVLDPIFERFVAGRGAQGFLQPCLRHKSLENCPNSRRLLLPAEFYWNTLDGKSSTDRISKNLLAIPRSRIRCASNNSDAKSLTLEGVGEIILNLSMLKSDACLPSASSIAVGITGTGKQQFTNC